LLVGVALRRCRHSVTSTLAASSTASAWLRSHGARISAIEPASSSRKSEEMMQTISTGIAQRPRAARLSPAAA
jgi:hypothetical protein